MAILSLILAFTLAPQSVAVRAAVPADGATLEVSSFYWGQIRKRVDATIPLSAQRASRMRRSRRGMEPPPLEPTIRETYALVRNRGGKTVKVVTWQYIFYADAKHERELRRFRFRTKQKLAPGEMKFLTTGVDEAAPSSFGAVVIETVEFEDGTVYSGSVGKSSS